MRIEKGVGLNRIVQGYDMAAIDPVCHMTVKEEKATATFQHDGRNYYFCAQGCRDAFMITREDVLQAVADAWWEKKPKIIEFVNKYLTREGARVFALEHTYFAAHFPRWFGNMYVEEVDDPTIHDTHHGSMVTFGEGLGMTRQEVLNHAPSIPMRMGIHYWDNVSRTRPWLEGFAAIGSLELTNHGELAARYGEVPLNARKKWEPLGLEPKYLVHWEAADAADPGESGHADETVRILVKYAKSDEEGQRVLSVVHESISVFRFIYDNIAERAIAAGKK